MPRLTFIIKNKKNEGLLFNSKELLALYFYGINIENTQGTTLDSSVIETYIKKAQQEVEKYLEIRFFKQIIEDRTDYYLNEFVNTGFIRTKLPVNKVISVEGYIGGQRQLSYPSSWCAVNTVNGVGTHKQFTIVPNSSVDNLVVAGAIFGGSIAPHLGRVNPGQIAAYWQHSMRHTYPCN